MFTHELLIDKHSSTQGWTKFVVGMGARQCVVDVQPHENKTANGPRDFCFGFSYSAEREHPQPDQKDSDENCQQTNGK